MELLSGMIGQFWTFCWPYILDHLFVLHVWLLTILAVSFEMFRIQRRGWQRVKEHLDMWSSSLRAHDTSGSGSEPFCLAT